MKSLPLSATLALFTAIAVLPSSIVAEEKPSPSPAEQNFGRFISQLQHAVNNNARIIGARILYIENDELKEIEYTTEPIIVNRGPAEVPAAETRAVVGATEECLSPDEPVLATGRESQYDLEWCKKKNSSPVSAKKNYYYQFSGGDYQLVATILYSCANADDKDAMPSAVKVICP